MFYRVRPVLHLPGVQTVRRHAKSACNFGNAVSPLSDLSDRFNLELFGISLLAHNHLSWCHFVWLKGV
jgi:hypothetical protein